MPKKLSIVFILLIISLSCSDGNSSKKAIDYFYPLKKGALYIYNVKFNEYLIKKQIKVEGIARKEGQVIFKISESQEYPAALIKEIEASAGTEIPKISRIYYEYVIQDNIIERQNVLEGNSKEKNVCLKGPIKKGTSWKIPGAGVTMRLEVPAKMRSDINANNKTKNYDSDTGRFNIKATVLDMKEMKVLGKLRKCIIVRLDLIYQRKGVNNPRMDLQYCKGIGYVGSYFNDEMVEVLIEVR